MCLPAEPLNRRGSAAVVDERNKSICRAGEEERDDGGDLKVSFCSSEGS